MTGDLLSECIIWTGARTNRGYGNRRINGRSVSTHRLEWEATHGPIPKGMYVCHHCDNPPCHNIDHLFLGTPQDNARDRDAKGRRADTSGERHPSAKLTWEQVNEIRDRYRAGGTSEVRLSGIYGVSKSHIHRIIHEQVWAIQEAS